MDFSAGAFEGSAEALGEWVTEIPLQLPIDIVYAITLSDDGHWAAIVLLEAVTIWDLQHNKLHWTIPFEKLPGEWESVKTATFTPAGYLILASRAGQFCQLDLGHNGTSAPGQNTSSWRKLSQRLLPFTQQRVSPGSVHEIPIHLPQGAVPTVISADGCWAVSEKVEQGALKIWDLKAARQTTTMP